MKTKNKIEMPCNKNEYLFIALNLILLIIFWFFSKGNDSGWNWFQLFLLVLSFLLTFFLLTQCGRNGVKRILSDKITGILFICFGIGILLLYLLIAKIQNHEIFFIWKTKINSIELKASFLIFTITILLILIIINFKNYISYNINVIRNYLSIILIIILLSSTTERSEVFHYFLKFGAGNNSEITKYFFFLILSNIWLFVIFPLILFQIYNRFPDNIMNIKIKWQKGDWAFIIIGLISSLFIQQILLYIKYGYFVTNF